MLVEIDDELLDHTFVVILAKLRRHEPVMLSWPNERGGLEQLLISPSTTVHAEFSTGQRSVLDRTWTERLMIAANSVNGICLATADLQRLGRTIPSAPTTVFRHRVLDGPRTAAALPAQVPSAGALPVP